MSSPVVSIVVPVYNVEKYLNACLDSILSQAYLYWECILVDDGSTDYSGTVCEKYVQMDSRFRVFHKKNGGVSSARNLGIEKANGEWLVFIDSDDLLYEYCLESFVNLIENGIDSVCGGYAIIEETNDTIMQYSSSNKYELLIGRDEALIDFYKHAYGDLFNGYLWNRMLRADIIKKNNLRFREDIFIKEDGLFLVQYLCRCKGLHAYTSLPIYKYRINPNGAMNTYSKSFNNKSISNLYARCSCCKEIELVSSKEELLKLAKDSISNMYRSLVVFMIRERNKNLIKFFEISITTFMYVSPLSILGGYLRNRLKRFFAL